MTKTYAAWRQISEGICTLLTAVSEDLKRMKSIECKKQEYDSTKKRNDEKHKRIKKEIAVCVKRAAEIDKQMLLLDQVRRPPPSINLYALKRRLQEKRRVLISEKHKLEHL